MRNSWVVLLVAGLILAIPNPAGAQNARPLTAAAPLRFESWEAAIHPSGVSTQAVVRLGVASPNRKRHALIGGAIGAAAGVVFCTAISTLSNDSADGGLSFCPLDSYLLIGGAGLVVGAVIGWVI